MENSPELLPLKGGGFRRFVTKPVRQVKEHLKKKGEIEKICKDIRKDSIALLEQRGKEVRVESPEPFEILRHPLFPIRPQGIII